MCYTQVQLHVLPAWPRYGPVSSRVLTVVRGPPPRKPSKRAKYGFKRIGEDWGEDSDVDLTKGDRLSGLLRRSRLPRSWQVLRAASEEERDADDDVWQEEAAQARRRVASRPRRLTAHQVRTLHLHGVSRGVMMLASIPQCSMHLSLAEGSAPKACACLPALLLSPCSFYGT